MDTKSVGDSRPTSHARPERSDIIALFEGNRTRAALALDQWQAPCAIIYERIRETLIASAKPYKIGQVDSLTIRGPIRFGGDPKSRTL